MNKWFPLLLLLLFLLYSVEERRLLTDFLSFTKV